jgi:outer membrane protein assembly factor BamB
MAEIMALDPGTGDIKWRQRMPAPARGAPSVADGRIFVPTVDNHLLALSTEDGRRLWTHRAQSVTSVPLGLPTPAVESDIVVAGFGSGELSALRTNDGRLVWSETLASANRGALSEVSGIHAMPVISEGRVVALGMGGLTICIDLRSGRRIWEREVGGTESAWMAGNWVFLVTSEEQLACLGRDDGRVRWVTDLRPAQQSGRRAPPRATWCPPMLAGSKLYIAGSGAELLTVDPGTGEIQARRGLPSGVSLPPAVIGDLMLVSTNNGTLVALRGT